MVVEEEVSIGACVFVLLFCVRVGDGNKVMTRTAGGVLWWLMKEQIGQLKIWVWLVVVGVGGDGDGSFQVMIVLLCVCVV